MLLFLENTFHDKFPQSNLISLGHVHHTLTVPSNDEGGLQKERDRITIYCFVMGIGKNMAMILVLKTNLFQRIHVAPLHTIFTLTW